MSTLLLLLLLLLTLSVDAFQLQPVFDFTKPTTINSFDRIDDVIMGGVSTSQLINATNYGKWFGICRTDGGGFCGVRTLPFQQPIQIDDDSCAGIYLKVRLVSDQEPQRRVWKVTTRVKPDRGEQLYQAMYDFPSGSTNFTTVKIPFSDFKLVRGPNLVPDGPPLNTTNGIYQIGLTMSKFPINDKPLENFRDGFFEVHIQEIGFYSSQTVATLTTATRTTTPTTLSKQESKKRLPLIVKLLLPISKIFFTEQSRRRRSAMNLLKKRGLSRWQAIRFGWKQIAKVRGKVAATQHTLGILAIDSFRSVIGSFLRLLLLPLRILTKAIRLVQKKKQPLIN